MRRTPWVFVFLITALMLAMFSGRVRGHVLRSRFYSPSLHQVMNVDIYVPPGYDATRTYPVLYLLHGKDGNANSWMNGFWGIQGIHVDHEATRLILHKRIRPMIIVSPELNNSYGINTSSLTRKEGDYDRGMYENYVTKDLVSYIDTHYHVMTNRSGRFIGGLSMGGFAALHDAFLHQGEFSKVGVMSPALWTGGLPSVLQWIYPTQGLQNVRDPITIARHTPIRLPVDIIEGRQDPFLAADIALYDVLRAHREAVVFHDYPGAHDDAFWQTHVDELLLFFGAS